MRLIDVNMLKAEFTGNFQKEYGIAQIKAIIDTMPTIEAEPVRHGEWIEKKKKTLFEGLYERNYVCSRCGNVVYGKYNYCCDCNPELLERGDAG